MYVFLKIKYHQKQITSVILSIFFQIIFREHDVRKESKCFILCFYLVANSVVHPAMCGQEFFSNIKHSVWSKLNI